MLLFVLGACSLVLNCLRAEARVVIDPMKHDIGVVTQATWNGKVLKFRNTTVFAVLFFNPDDDNTKTLIDNEYDQFAKKMKGIVEVLAVDCNANRGLCKDQNATHLPQITIFPPFPLPPFPYQGPKDPESMTKAVVPLIPSNIKSVANSKELDALIASTVQMPKVLIFSQKPKPSVLVKALSNAFKDKLTFVVLNGERFPEYVKKYKVTSFPHLVVVRKDKKDEVYKGAFEFQKLFDWLNVFSETFVMGGGFSDTNASAAEFDPELQPWKLETIPELTRQSSQDVCFKKSNKFVCVVLVKNGRELSAEEKELMESFKDDYEGHSGKGPDFRFMWMDLETEKEWAELFDVADLPSIVAVNPHKKVRFVKLDAGLPATTPHIRKLLDKISTGDARFKIVPASKVPKFVERKDAKKDEKVAKAERGKDEL